MKYLILANGRIFEGRPFGASGTARGTLVFTTEMTGCLETLTDPTHFGQLVVSSFPLMGNYGVIPDEFISDAPGPSALIVREVCDAPSNFRSEGPLSDYMKRAGVPGLCGIDTRALVRIVRDEGAMNAALIDALPGDMDAFLKDLKAHRAPDGVAARTCAAFEAWPVAGAVCRAAVWDFGAAEMSIRALNRRGVSVVRAPAHASADDILAHKPDGVLLSDGPGDPAEKSALIKEIGALYGRGVPVLAVGLGHLMLALSQGGAMETMKFGHHGANQPVRDAEGNRLYITAQNHRHVLAAGGIPRAASVRFSNLNDQTVEGLFYADTGALSVQFRPDDEDDPLSTGYIYDAFIARMGA